MLPFIFLGLTLVLIPKDISADRIIGGTNATIEEFPYQVSVQVNLSLNEYHHNCGGSILSETIVLTAAHCLKRNDIIYMVRYGSTQQASGGKLLRVKHKVLHERYNLDGWESHDIALLFLSESIQFSEKAERIELPETTDIVPIGEMLTVTGWGVMENARYFAANLQKLSVPMVDAKECKAISGGDKILPGMFCAGFIGTEGKGTCSGDSGGPLVWKRKQYGVVSWGIVPCGKGKLNVYTDVAYYRKWIDSTIKTYYETN